MTDDHPIFSWGMSVKEGINQGIKKGIKQGEKTGVMPGYLGAIGSVFVWALLPFLIKSGVSALPVIQFLVLRFLVSSLVLLPSSAAIKRKWRNVSPTQWSKILSVSSAIYLLQALALKDIPASIYVVLYSATPVLTIFLLGIRLRPLAWLCVALCLASSVVFVWNGGDYIGKVSILAAVAMIGGIICWAYYTSFIHELQEHFNDFEVAQIMNLCGLFSSLFMWILVDRNIPVDLSVQQVIYPVLLGLIVPVGYYLFSLSLRVTPVFAVTSQYFEPIFAVSLSAMLLKERLTTLQLVSAIACIAFAFFLGELTKSREQSTSPQI